MQQNLLQELRDLQAVLDAETGNAIPVLSDVVAASPAAAAAISSTEGDAEEPTPNYDNIDSSAPTLGDGIPVSDRVAAEADTGQTTTEAAANDSATEPPLITKEPAKPAPFALIESSAEEYDSSAAESLIEDGLHDALKSLTVQMDDEALRVVEELIAEHAELIRQQLKLKLAAKSEQLSADRNTETT